MKLQKKIAKEPYNKEIEKPLIRASICTGEKVAGFKNLATGQFREIMLIRDDNDMDFYLEKYDIDIAEIKTEW